MPSLDVDPKTTARPPIVLAGVVALIAVASAAAMLAAYAADPAALWRDLTHDRNGHFAYGLDVALALRSLDPIGVIDQLMRAKVWPPVHGLVLAAVLLVGGLDVKLAIVPSLIGWTCTMVLTFLIAGRVFADRTLGAAAGATAVAFALASPAFRLIAADVMLEGLGAALSAFAIYAYLRARAEPANARWWRVLALALTALFFEKFNYWALTIVPIALATIADDPRAWARAARSRLAVIDARSAIALAARDAFAIAFAVLAVLIVAILAVRPAPLQLWGREVSLFPPGNLVTIAWAVLFAGAARLWRRRRAGFDDALGLAGRKLFYWHVVPIAVSFLFPQRLSIFLWYVGPTHFAQTRYDPWQALLNQWAAFANGFHVAPWAATLVVLLAVAGAAGMRRLSPGARVLPIMAALSAAAVVLHPQQQPRFQTTWLFAVWDLAGIGGALLLAAVAPLWPRVRASLAAAAVVALAAGESRYAASDTAFAVAIHPRSGPSDLALAEAYLPHLGDARTVGFLATFGRTPLLIWTTRLSCRCRTAVDMPWLLPFLSRDQIRSIAVDWLARTPAERLVVIDAPAAHGPAFIGWTHDRLSALLDALKTQNRFEQIAVETAPAFDATVTVWRRR